MNIRKATPADAKTIAKIHTNSWQKNYAQVLTSHYLNSLAPAEREAIWCGRLLTPKQNQHVVVAEIDAEAVGFACVYFDENSEFGAYLDNLHVVSAHQNKSIGAHLLRSVALTCLDVAPGSGLCLLVNQSNTRAQSFYLKLGAQNVREDVWLAPDASRVATFWFVWPTLTIFAQT
jgi:ribosomal protein S18 acetylase RimI-like enzyme